MALRAEESKHLMEPSTQNYNDPVIATQAKNLTKAIFQTESGGNFNAKGKSNEFGAGQWQPATWKAHAKDVLGNENAPMTPENQSVVAQGTIRKLISQGKNAAQIAAIWNSGSDENWQNKVGKNEYGVDYNVPKYVKSVTDAYQTLKQGGQVSADPNNPSSTANVDNQPEQKSLGGFLGNVVKSGANAIGGLVSAVAHPIQTAKNLGNLGLGVAEKFIPGEQGQEKYANAVGQLYKQRYGGLKNIGETLYNDPVGAAIDASALLSGGGAIVGKVGRLSEASRAAELAKGAGLAENSLEAQMIAEGAKGTSLASKAGELASSAGQAIDPLRLAGKAVGRVISPITTRLGAIPEKFLATELQLNPSDVRRIALGNVAGESPYAWLKKNNIFGSRDNIIKQLGDISKESKQAVDTSLSSVKTLYSAEQVPRVEQTLKYITSKFGDTIGNEDVLAKTQEMLSKAQAGQLTLTDVNEVKRLIDDTLGVYKRSGAVGDTVAAKGLANVRNEIKTFIEDEAAKNGITNIKELNKRTQVAEEIRRSALKKELGQQGNRILSLTDMITISGFSAASGVDGGFGMLAAKRILESSAVKSFIARRIAKWTTKSLNDAEEAVKSGTPNTELQRILQEAYQYARQNPSVLAEAGILSQQ